jgi:membrane-associated protease RseP (regulator of RpoE activity)
VADTLLDAIVPLTVMRNDQNQKPSLTVGELPKDIAASLPPELEIEEFNPLAGVMVGPLSKSPRDFLQNKKVFWSNKLCRETPAARSGIRKGDILEINHQSITSLNDFRKTVNQAQDPVLVLIQRNEASIFLSI